MVAVFTRPYPMITKGVPVKLSFDIISKSFRYEFEISPENGFTEIYIPPLIYPNRQFELELSDSLSWEFSDNNANVIVVHMSSDRRKEVANPVFVSIKPYVKVHLL